MNRLLLLSLLCLGSVGDMAWGQQAATDNRCYGCHISKFAEFEEREDIEKFLEVEKIRNWRSKDMHARAFLSIFESPVGQRMCRNLNIPLTSEIVRSKKNLAEILAVLPDDRSRQVFASCLSCHTTGRANSTVNNLLNGVGCQSCHGEVPDVSKGYYTPHQFTAWRTKSPADKLKLDMVDVRTPMQLAKQCASCHVGAVGSVGSSNESGIPAYKIVTHEMYAAGHPPLGNFELATYLEHMPRHWKTFEEKGDFKRRAEYQKQNRMASESKYRRSWRVFSGGSATWEAWRATTASIAAGQLTSATRWPELASFDCFACHHELSAEAPVATRTPPGRPYLLNWPAKLGTLALDDSNNKSSADKLTQLFSSVGKVPFGRAAEVASHCKSLNVFAQTRDGILALFPADKPFLAKQAQVMVRRALLRLTHQAAQQPLDFYSARQLTWALHQMSQDEIPATATEYWTALRAVQQQLGLPVLAGNYKFDVAEAKNNQYPISLQLEPSLDRIYAYKREDFRGRLKALDGLLKAELAK